jgi:hypothetical protein
VFKITGMVIRVTEISLREAYKQISRVALPLVLVLARVHRSSETGIGIPDFRLFGAIFVDVAR